MKIGITTFFKAHNYGAVLQCYALQKVLETTNSNVEIINYYDSNVYDGYKLIRKISFKNPKSILGFCKDLLLPNKIKKERYKKFNSFINNNFKLSNVIYDKNELEDCDYNILITGSDQVWNESITKGLSDIYTLNFGKNEIKRISYAASVGNNQLMIENKDEYRNKLKKIDYISVREDDTRIELEKILNRKIEVVLDPTLLITKNDWENVIKSHNIENVITKKYILAYHVDNDSEYMKIVNYLSKETGLPVIHFNIRNPGYYNVLKTAFSDGPIEFINYIKNAEYVVATSFHATVFSIIFNKKFFIIPHKKTGIRVMNLLNLFQIKGRSFSKYEDFIKIDYNFNTDWNAVNEKIWKERELSIQWLMNAIDKDES